jgi:hypothetical protein
MVQHPWIFVVLLLAGLSVALLPHGWTKNPKNTYSNKQNRGQ